MVSIKFVYDLVNDLADKNNSRFIDKEEFTRYAQVSNLELFDECIGATNKKVNKQTNVVYGVSQNLDSRLDPFRTGQSISIVDGEGALPTNLEKITNIVESKARPVAIKRIDDDRLGMLFGNPLREPDEDEVYYREVGNKTIEILGLRNSVYVNYLRTPVAPVYSTVEETITVGSRTVTREVYDEATSVDFEWNEREAIDLVTRILQKAGIPMKDQFLEQMVSINKVNE